MYFSILAMYGSCGWYIQARQLAVQPTCYMIYHCVYLPSCVQLPASCAYVLIVVLSPFCVIDLSMPELALG